MPNNRWNDKTGRYPIATVDFRTVDQAVQDYFVKRVKLSVDGPNARHNVPVVFAGAERWNSKQKDNPLRDENGTLILPILSLRRTDVARDKGFNGLATEQSNITIAKKLANKTSVYTQLVQQRIKNGFPVPKESGQVYEHFSIPFPDSCTMFYEITAWSQYQSQMNEIMEQIVYAYDYNDSFVMPVDYTKDVRKKNGYYFVAFNDGNFSYDSNFQEMTGTERIIRYTFRIKVPVYLMLNPKNEPTAYGFDKGGKNSDNRPVVYKYEGATQITVSERTVNRLPQKERSEDKEAENFKIVLK